MKHFVLIGAGGYIAPRHMQAIKNTGNTIVAAMDKFDSVGIIDRYFPNADFFVEFERLDRHLEKLKQYGQNIDYVSICTPNYLHDAHIRFSLRHQADAICEKPLVLNPWNAEALEKIEKETGKKVYNILQLRLHADILALKDRIDSGKQDKVYDIDLTYITSRGKWYYASWKGNAEKSGGIATNIGVHFFDMLAWIFGEIKQNTLHIHTHDRAAGYLEFEKARVRWFLSINFDTLPDNVKMQDKRIYRSIVIDGKEIEFSAGFEDLHTKSYQKIMNGEGFSINSTYPSLNIIHNIRTQVPIGPKGNYHPLAKYPLSKHPFQTPL